MLTFLRSVCLLATTLAPATLLAIDPLQAETAFSVPLSLTDGATYALNASVEGYGELELMLDTGAVYTTLSHPVITTLIKNGKATQIGELRARLADGSFCPLKIYRVSALRIGNDCELKDVEVAVASKHSRNLLGLSALAHTAPFTVNLEPATLEFRNCKLPAVSERVALR